MRRLLISCVIFMMGSMAYADFVGPAGCGLGNLLMGGKKMQTLASTTNATFYSQFFGITSGTSGCKDSSSSAELENFLDVNQYALATEASKGEGESIQTLAEILGCSSSANLAKVLKQGYSSIFHAPSLSVKEIGSGILNQIEANKLQGECTRV